MPDAAEGSSGTAGAGDRAHVTSGRVPKAFSPPGTPLRYAPDRPFRVAHVRLEIELDLVEQTLTGRATLRIEARRDGVATVTLDAVELTVDDVSVDGSSVGAAHRDHDGEKLRLRLPRALARRETAEVTIEYHARPRRGLYFIGPDAAHPDRAPQCWTQGQDDDSRFYWPCIDTPGEKAPM